MPFQTGARLFAAFAVLLLLCGCGRLSDHSNKEWKTIEVGNYLLDFPPDFELIKDEGIDSYVGRIKGDSIIFGFDYGYFSDDLGPTLDEFLKEGNWRDDLYWPFMKADSSYNISLLPDIEVLKVRQATYQDSGLGTGTLCCGCDYIATCKYADTVFLAAVYVPAKTKSTVFEIDTIGKMYRKIVYQKEPGRGIVGLYLKQTDEFNESLNSQSALSMAATKLSAEQQELALKIFKTARHRAKSKW
jgi:hypothetical protein